MRGHRLLSAVATDAGLRSVDGALRLTSASNEAWKVGEVVVRISWSGDADRVRREVLVLEHLPPSVPHPEVLGHGTTDGRTWTLTRWVPGDVAATTWPTMTSAARDGFARRLAEALAALHRWSPAPEVRMLVAQRAPAGTVDALIGQDVNPLPIDRALALVEEAKRAPHAAPSVIDAVADRLQQLRASDVDRVDGVVFLRADEESGSADVITRLSRHYPSIVGHPRIVERLWLYDLACTLRDVIVCPLTGSARSLPPHHPLHRLPVIVRSPSYIERLLG